MSAQEKAFELQRQVRQNAREYENSVKDLYSWEQDIKNKEKELQKSPLSAANKDLPVRSHVQTDKSRKESPSSSAASSPTEKQDLPVDPVAQQYKKANDIKDRGNTYVKQGEYEKAIVAYSTAIAVYPHDPIYHINRALCYLKQESFDQCVEDCEAAIALDKLCVKAYYRRMQANESLGNNMEALKDCTTVLAIEPKNIEAKRSLARINDRLRKIATKSGPNFTPDRPGMIEILPIEKPAYKRSKKAMRSVPVVDVVSPRATIDDSNQLRISDEDIDKIFNSNCGIIEEVKKTNPKPTPMPDTSGPPKAETIAKTSKEVKPTKQTAVKVAPAVETPKETETRKDTKIVPESDNEAKPSAPKKTAVEVPKVQTQVSPPKTTIERSPEVNTVQTEKIEQASSNNAMSPSPIERFLPPAPTSTAQFHVTWKELSGPQKYQYLKSIEVPNLCKILGAGFDSDTFADLLRTIHDFFVPNKEPNTAAVLLEISKNDEFTILAMLMSAEEKKMVSSILNAIKNWPSKNPAVLDNLFKEYGVA
uniref:RNA polymerase II-associated protein 3 n=1 Tax=Drosophila melanogaster TaxID=7227 RepID=Q9V3E9_DROME|nr:spaghetti [Drosophila melanogaster]AAF47175.1 spaghetti [Drosophila melanogaster]AHB12554.1 FI17138p1 [Drosophila melanogaster]CAB64598.2 spaghetti [Drosophila melanogaster]|eukprot:NP_524664.1 spaghetti [Drosophila melanogaster]